MKLEPTSGKTFKPFKLVIETMEEAICLWCHLSITNSEVVRSVKNNVFQFEDFDIKEIVEDKGVEMWELVEKHMKPLREVE